MAFASVALMSLRAEKPPPISLTCCQHLPHGLPRDFLQHWLNPLKQQASTGTTTTVTGHHAAAVVVGRRGLGCTAR
ncbi:hypothetical protein ACFVYG_07765 [Streptomyces sp. NPDC058256]|uniref:hypothetical protein n=1 Tax=Streptomyces sp. NPDC058256 TaxID=3346408 RepID=UPI0036E802DF